MDPAALFDIDGTLALHGERNPYNWRDSPSDRPNEPVVRVLHALHRDGCSIVYISGRPEEARPVTESWLSEFVGVQGPLHLRSNGDRRPDSVVKREIFGREIRPLFDVFAVFDDREQVVRMWREEVGLPCLQVAAGQF